MQGGADVHRRSGLYIDPYPHVEIALIRFLKAFPITFQFWHDERNTTRILVQREHRHRTSMFRSSRRVDGIPP